LLRTFKQACVRPGLWVFVAVGAVAFFLLLHTYAQVYSPAFGLTKLLQVGHEFDDRGLDVFRATPKYIGPASRLGFDGQFYGELALDPLLRDPRLRIALDDPPYRSRRILLPWLAWLGGLGRPFWILNAYAVLNFAFWIGFVVMLVGLFRPYGWKGIGGFAAMLMTCGIIESMRSSLTDFPGFVLLTLAMMVGGAGGAGVLALSTLAREPNIIGLLGILEYRPPWMAAIRRNLVLCLIAGLPPALWFAYVFLRFPPEESLAGGNLTWPLRGIMAKLGEFSVLAAHGGVNWSKWYSEFYSSEALHALLTIVSTLTQCLFLLIHREWTNRIWRAGAIFVPYFLCISFIPWEHHFTVTRHALPITLAFNLVLALRARRGWLAWFLLGNCFVPYGVYVFTIQNQGVANPPPDYRIIAAQPSAAPLSLQFTQGWSNKEWGQNHAWRWGAARHATLTVSNPTAQPVAVTLSFVTRSVSQRDLTVSVRGVSLWSARSLESKVPVQTPPFLVPPGETVVDFVSSGSPVRSGHWNDDRLLSFMVQDLLVNVSVPSPGG
jgi:hypothetical protein